ncbi:hypothetical protein C5167_006113 [Papaver somniferum]|uniref:Uncharacterized protein n=1 Tax=Papaver somniferum TaxID=3469 RepID=A0A4Y7JFJ6_PAPSO|nr:hypothetical protein C5167_006113 [Papaver somniferum]
MSQTLIFVVSNTPRRGGPFTLVRCQVRSTKACDLDLKRREHAVTYQLVPGQREVLYPQPCRDVRTQYTVDRLQRLCCTLRG